VVWCRAEARREVAAWRGAGAEAWSHGGGRRASPGVAVLLQGRVGAVRSCGVARRCGIGAKPRRRASPAEEEMTGPAAGSERRRRGMAVWCRGRGGWRRRRRRQPEAGRGGSASVPRMHCRQGVGWGGGNELG